MNGELERVTQKTIPIPVVASTTRNIKLLAIRVHCGPLEFQKI